MKGVPFRKTCVYMRQLIPVHAHPRWMSPEKQSANYDCEPTLLLA